MIHSTFYRSATLAAAAMIALSAPLSAAVGNPDPIETTPNVDPPYSPEPGAPDDGPTAAAPSPTPTPPTDGPGTPFGGPTEADPQPDQSSGPTETHMSTHRSRTRDARPLFGQTVRLECPDGYEMQVNDVVPGAIGVVYEGVRYTCEIPCPHN